MAAFRCCVALLLISMLLPLTAHADPIQRTLVLDPSEVHWGGEDFHSDNLFDGDEPGCSPSLDLPVGYTHNVFINTQDSWRNCVFQTAIRFDLSGVHLYPGAVITRATLTYTERFATLLLPDGHPAGSPYDLNQDAVWSSCVARLAVPTADWRNDIGLTPNEADDTLDRLDRSTWDVTNQARHWYVEPDFQNFGLILLGYDESDGFSNNAACLAGLSDFKLQVELVANAPTPAPSPTPGRNYGIAPALPDLVITAVDTVGRPAEPRGLRPVCPAGRDTTFTVHVRNVGTAATTDFAVVSLSIDGVPRATTTVDALAPGVERTTNIEGMVLSAGTHAFSVTVNAGQKLFESDFSNNSFANDHLVCS